MWLRAPAAPASGVATAFLFRCPYTRDTIIAARADRRVLNKVPYVCYRTFRTKAAATMYVLSVGGE
jgi:hypothetical protein